MTGSEGTPNHGEVRRILAAAADVLFSDGVADDFLDQWTEETIFLMSFEPSRSSGPYTRRRS